MKNLIVIFCIAISTISLMNAQSVRIGSLEFSVKKKAPGDTIMEIVSNDPCPPCPSDDKSRSKSKYKYHETSFFAGLGFMVPDYSSDYYTALGGNSLNIDAGWQYRYSLSRRFSIGGTLQYSYYNYRMRDAASDPIFMEEVIGHPINPDDIDKQMYRTHNAAAGVYTRFYIVPTRWHSNNDGMYLDLGIQGDFAFSKYYKINTHSSGKDKYHDNYAFNPFMASAYVRLGWEWFAVVARYRLTDAFNSKALPMDLPPLSIGIQFM